MTVRPTSYAPGATLGNPGNAIDNNDSTTSGAALGRQCSTTCTTPTSATATWRGTPDGFRPIRLEIHWQANAITSLYGNDTASIDAKVEYSLDGGGGWSQLEHYTWTQSAGSCAGDHGIVCTDHIAQLSLSNSQSTGAIQVRATLTVQLTHCDNCSSRISNLMGQIWVYDVRIIAAPPSLTLSSSPVVRGDSDTFTVQGAPGATYSSWAFVTSTVGAVARTVNTGSATWTGTIVSSGTGSVHVVVIVNYWGNTSNTYTYDLSAPLTVTPRSWPWSPLSPSKVPNGTFRSLPVPPVPGGALGASRLDLAYTFHDVQLSDNGPNHGLWYVLDFDAVSGSNYRYEISPDLEDTSSQFYTAQCGNYNALTDTGYISGATLLSNTQQHEYGTALGHYQQYLSAFTDPANNMPALAEAKIAGAATDEATFGATVKVDEDAALTRITSAMEAETACNTDVRMDTGCVFRGYINFSPYQSCQ
jgi:hypothetical protein